MQLKISYSVIIFLLTFLSLSIFISISFLALLFITTFLGFVFLNTLWPDEKIPKPFLLFSFAMGLSLMVFVTFLYKLVNIKLNFLTIVVTIAALFIFYIFSKIKKKREIPTCI